MLLPIKQNCYSAISLKEGNSIDVLLENGSSKKVAIF